MLCTETIQIKKILFWFRQIWSGIIVTYDRTQYAIDIRTNDYIWGTWTDKWQKQRTKGKTSRQRVETYKALKYEKTSAATLPPKCMKFSEPLWFGSIGSSQPVSFLPQFSNHSAFRGERKGKEVVQGARSSRLCMCVGGYKMVGQSTINYSNEPLWNVSLNWEQWQLGRQRQEDHPGVGSQPQLQSEL